jgi:hypothetical protein
MTGLIRKATLLTAAGLIAAGAVSAGVPNAGTTTRPGGVVLCPKDPTQPLAAAAGLATFTVRDAGSSPVPNAVVIIAGAGCTGTEIRLASNQPHAGVFVNCAAKSVSAVTNASGVATFRLLGRVGTHPGFATGKVTGCASVTADGVPLGPINIAVADQNGVSGCNAADGSLFLADRDAPASPKNQARSDFNGVGNVNAADGSLFLQLRDFSGADVSEGADCP